MIGRRFIESELEQEATGKRVRFVFRAPSVLAFHEIRECIFPTAAPREHLALVTQTLATLDEQAVSDKQRARMTSMLAELDALLLSARPIPPAAQARLVDHMAELCVSWEGAALETAPGVVSDECTPANVKGWFECFPLTVVDAALPIVLRPQQLEDQKKSSETGHAFVSPTLQPVVVSNTTPAGSSSDAPD